MALNNAATLVVKTGRFYLAPVGTPAPADGAALRLGPFQLTTLRIRPGSTTTTKE